MGVRVDSPRPHAGIGEIVAQGKSAMLGYYRNENMMLEMLASGGRHSFAMADSDRIHLSDLEIKFDEVRRLEDAERKQFCQIAAIRLYPEEFEKAPKRRAKRFLYAHGTTKS